MKEYKVNLTAQFKEELKETLYFFPHSYNTKRKLHHDIRNTVASLSIFPERYSKINKNLKAQNIRKLPINKFIVIYEVDNEKYEVYILHIFLQRQDYLNQIWIQKILFKLKSKNLISKTATLRQRAVFFANS